MPICQIKTNYEMNNSERLDFIEELTNSLTDILKKPVPAIMIMISNEIMYMNRTDDTVVFAEFRYVMDFADEEEKKKFLSDFSDRMFDIFRKHTNVNPYRIYMQFTEMPRDGAWRYIEK